jgi:hypothetical protein
VEDMDVRLENYLNVKPIISLLLGTFEVEAQLKEDAIPSKLSEITPLETETVRERSPIKIDKEVGVYTPVTMAQEGSEVSPILPIDTIDPLI